MVTRSSTIPETLPRTLSIPRPPLPRTCWSTRIPRASHSISTASAPYMAAVKIEGMVVANISDERSAYMTREHNGSRMVTMGPGVVGTEVAKEDRPRVPARPSTPAAVTRSVSTCLTRWPNEEPTENSNFYLNL